MTGALVGALTLGGAAFGSLAPAVAADEPGDLAFSAGTFANPPADARVQYRYWWPSAIQLDEAQIREDVGQMAAAGAGGIEVATLGFLGAGGPEAQPELGWGTDAWAASFNVLLDAALEHGLEVSGTIGPGWPARVPTLTDPNDPRVSKALYAAGSTVAPAAVATVVPVPQPTDLMVGAVPTLLDVVIADCADPACAATANAGRTVLVDRASTAQLAVDTADTPDVADDTITVPAGTGTQQVMAFWQAPEGGASTGANGPMYLTDHLSVGGAEAITDYWDTKILAYGNTRDLIAQHGGIQLFEDSLELDDSLKWTDGMSETWQTLRGYDPTLALPALGGAGAQACATFEEQPGVNCEPPAFDFSDGTGADIRRDYRQTFSDLYIGNRLETLVAWGAENGIRIKAQAYGEPIDVIQAASVLDSPEGESLAFTSNPEYYKLIASGAHHSGNTIVSTECCAVFGGAYRTESDDYLDFVHRGYAGGVTKNVWHGYAYANAAEGYDTWPGWDAFFQDASDPFGPRMPMWEDYGSINDHLGRAQLILRQGQPAFDVAVYWDGFGMTSTQSNGNNLGGGEGKTLNEGSIDVPDTLAGSGRVQVKTAMNAAGFTYEYLSPAQARTDDAVVTDGRLFAEKSAYKAVVLHNQESISVESAQRLQEWAEAGLPIVIVGDAPATAPGDSRASDAEIVSIFDDLEARSSVRSVDTEASVPDALSELGVAPAVAQDTADNALAPLQRVDGSTKYFMLQNQTDADVTRSVSLEGGGQPYLLDTWRGAITPIAQHSTTDSAVQVEVEVPARGIVFVALSADGIDGVPAPTLTVTSTTADAVTLRDGTLLVEAAAPGTYVTELSDGRVLETEVGTAGTASIPSSWNLAVESWFDDPAVDDYTVVSKEPLAPVTVTPDGSGALPAWSGIDGIGSAVSGQGEYSTTLTLDENWTPGDRALLDLGDATDTVAVFVNGTQVTVDQASLGAVDISSAARAGDNELTIRVSSLLWNAIKADAPDEQQGQYGLFGPVSVKVSDVAVVDLDGAVSPEPTATTEPTTAQPTTAPTSTSIDAGGGTDGGSASKPDGSLATTGGEFDGTWIALAAGLIAVAGAIAYAASRRARGRAEQS